jgi:hypothetical protein
MCSFTNTSYVTNSLGRSNLHPWKWAFQDRWSVDHPWKWDSLASIGVGWRLFWHSFVFPIAAFAIAIFVNNLLNFLNASALSPLRETVFLNVLVSSDAAFMMSVSGMT